MFKDNYRPLTINTFDGFNSPYHPSVLYFEDGWNGWNYWMVETPFSPKSRPYRDRNECPSIHVSNDGINWKEPQGLENPLVNLGVKEINDYDYYSDPHLVYHDNRLECWFRLTQRHGQIKDHHDVSLRMIYSYDGIHWSKQIIISYLSRNQHPKGLGKMVVSPALIYNGQYNMWYVNSDDHNNLRHIAYSTSQDGIKWSDNILCNLIGKDINPWHIDVMQNDESIFYLSIYDKNDITLWKSEDGLNFKYLKILISPSKHINSFYNNGLYRACLVQDSIGYKLYYSADDGFQTYIGLLEFNNVSENPKNPMSEDFSNFGKTFVKYLKYKKRSLDFILKHSFKRLNSRT